MTLAESARGAHATRRCGLHSGSIVNGSLLTHFGSLIVLHLRANLVEVPVCQTTLRDHQRRDGLLNTFSLQRLCF